MSERIDTAALLASIDLVAVVGAYVPLKKVGGEFSGLCPFHGEKTPSFTVIPAKQFCHCFGCGFSGDAIAFVQAIEDCDFKVACERLGANTWTALPIDTSRPKVPTKEWFSVLPPADDPRPAHFRHYKHGEPTGVWTYLGADGAILGYVCRYDFGSNGSRGKTYQPFTYGHFEGEEADYWSSKTWTRGKRPLYGLDRLAARPGDPVILTEGEKACDAAGILLPQYVAVAWPGGAQAVRHAEFGPLAGRRLLLWPDAGTVGIECMESLARLLSDPRGLACDPVKLVDVSDWADGRDLADCLAENWTPDQVMEWAAPRVKVHAAPQHHATEQNPEADQVPEQATAGEGAPFPSPDPAEGPPPMEFPPEASAEKPRRRKPRLAVVQGNTVTAPDPDAEVVPFELSEAGVAEDFANQYADDFRYCHEWKCWLHWTGSRWQRKESKASRVAPWQRMQALCYWLKHRAGEMTMLSKLKFETKKFMASALDIAEYNKLFVVTPEQFDANHFLLGTPGGSADLATGELLPARRDHFMTRQTSVAPAKGPHPLFDSVVSRATGGDANLTAYIWRWLGYFLTGDVREESFLFLYGKPQSGKTTLIEVIAQILGERENGGYAQQCDMEMFTETKIDRGSDRLASLHGARFAYASETEEGRNWKASLLKLATGGDTLGGRFLYAERFTFKPTHKLLIFGNERPHLRSADNGVKRRIHLLEYPGVISNEERDNTLKARLVEEYPAILYSMIQSCVEWQRIGLGRPMEIEENVEEYISSEDSLGAWLEERTKRDMNASELISDIHRDFSTWARSNGEWLPSTKRLTQLLVSRGFARGRAKGGKRALTGFSLRFSDTDTSAPPPWHSEDR